MSRRSPRENALIALIVVLCTGIVYALVVLDHFHHVWLALLVYLAIYVVIAVVERRTGRLGGRRPHGTDGNPPARP